MTIQVSKAELGELIIARNQIAQVDDRRVERALRTLDALIGRVISEAAPALAVNSINHLHH